MGGNVSIIVIEQAVFAIIVLQYDDKELWSRNEDLSHTLVIPSESHRLSRPTDGLNS